MSDYHQRLEKTVDNLKQKLGSVRTGRANPELLSFVSVDYYGSKVPINQLSSISASEGNTLILNIFDNNAVGPVEKAIMTSDLGLTPRTEGSIIRLKLPDLTEERRLELIKYVKKLGEEAKVSLRNIRRDEIDRIKKSSDHSDDDKKRLTGSIQKKLDDFTATIDALLTDKEAEIKQI